MKRLALLCLLCLLGLSQSAFAPFAVVGGAPAAGGCEVTDSDAFSTNGSPPSDWTEGNGSFTVASNIMNKDDSTANAFIYHNTQTTNLDQWFLVEYDVFNDTQTLGGIVLRQTGSAGASNKFYLVRYDDMFENLDFRYCDNPASLPGNPSCTTDSEPAHTMTAGDYISVKVTGTGSGTTIEFWNHGASDPGDDPDSWGAADITWTNTSGVYADVGKYAGLYDGTATATDNVDFANGSFGSCP